MLNAWLCGAIAMVALTIALFFLRYWNHSRDRLFLYFSLAFVLESVHRGLRLTPATDPDEPLWYLIRLLEYGLILFAIIQKNRQSAAKSRQA